MEKRNNKLLTLVEGAIIVAVAMVLSLIPIELPNAAFELSLGLIPLAVYAVRRGLLPAVVVGAMWGLLRLVGGKAYILSIPQFILEYPFAFAFGGMFGLFAKQIRASIAGLPVVRQAKGWQEKKSGEDDGRAHAVSPGGNENKPGKGSTGSVMKWVVFASIATTLSRWFWHFIAGAVVWAEYAPEEMNPWLYSLIMNGASFIANAIMLIIVMTALVKAAPRLFKV